MPTLEKNALPLIKGLVLAGGISSRMGIDKGLIDYHGKPQREYLLDILRPFTEESFISCRPGQIINHDLSLLEDTYHDLGPFSGILSAFNYDSACAWLVIACDFPLLDRTTIKELIVARDTSAIATNFYDAHAQLPEPWITILEPKIFPILLEYYKKGRSSLRGILQDHPGHVVHPKNPNVLLNANTVEDIQKLKDLNLI